MKIEGNHELHARQQRVYQTLIDPVVPERCIPGSDRPEKRGKNAYLMTLVAEVGSAISPVFSGRSEPGMNLWGTTGAIRVC